MIVGLTTSWIAALITRVATVCDLHMTYCVRDWASVVL